MQRIGKQYSINIRYMPSVWLTFTCTLHVASVVLTILISEKMLGLNIASRDENSKCYALPPIITHTEATPMATPQGSPNEHNDSDLTVGRGSDINSLTVEVPTVSEHFQYHNYKSQMKTINQVYLTQRRA